MQQNFGTSHEALTEKKNPGIHLHAQPAHLKGVRHSVQELDDKQRRDLGLDDGEEEELAPVDGDEIVVRGLQDRRHILRVRRLLLGLEEVIADAAADDALPVFLQEDVSRVVNQEQAVDHLSCNSEAVVPF